MEHKGSNQSLVKVTNQNLILQEIRANTRLSRSELAKRLQLSNPSVSKHVDELLAKGLLVESGSLVTDVGRRPIMLQFNAAHGCVAVIDLSSSNARLCVADLSGNKLEYSRVDGDHIITSREIDLIISTLRDMLAHLGDRCGGLVGICIGVPGLVSPSSGQVLRSSRFEEGNIPDLVSIIGSAFSVPVFVRSDVCLAVAGEHIFGSGQEHSTLLLLNIDLHSISLGAVINGLPYEGSRGFACDVEQLMLPAGDQPVKLRPMSKMLSLDCLVEDVRTVIEDGRESLLKEWVSDPAELHFDDVARAWGMNDTAVGTIVRQFAKRVALAYQNLTSLFDPELILIGGQASKLGATFVNEINRFYEALSSYPTELKLAKLSDSAVIFGGIDLAAQQAVNRIVMQ